MLNITQLEEAINRWRRLKPAEISNCALCREASELATLYAQLILSQQTELPLHLLTESQKNLLAQVLGPRLDASEPAVHSKAA